MRQAVRALRGKIATRARLAKGGLALSILPPRNRGVPFRWREPKPLGSKLRRVITPPLALQVRHDGELPLRHPPPPPFGQEHLHPRAAALADIELRSGGENTNRLERLAVA